jgi:molybdate/tungstate transport system substrate-binding protein
MKKTFNIIVLTMIIFVVIIYGCKRKADGDTLRIIHAGSLSMIVKEVCDSFVREHPDMEILTEAWGSKDGARQITELGKPCDLFISADERVIHTFLMPGYATWSLPFAGNEMVIAYTLNSRYADAIRPDNWYEILGRKDVFTARSSPDADPCGVRAVMMMMLSERYYQEYGISRKLLEKDRKFMRPREVDLIALLEKQQVDYLYIYKSIAVQHGFLYLALPDEVNLSNPALDSVYRKVSFQTTGKTPGSSQLETGASIIYGLTIPSEAKNRDGALEFLKYFLDPDKGGAIIQKNGQNFLATDSRLNASGIPDSIRTALKKR